MKAKIITAPTYWVKVYIASAEDVSSWDGISYVLNYVSQVTPVCVTITKTLYRMPTGVMEYGWEIGLINYPRFPRSPEELVTIGKMIAKKAILAIPGVDSASIMTPELTYWYSSREEDIKDLPG